ncbi:hypothetical protein [Streptomyces sp. SID9727]|uniref:DUF6892 domain-containing protein n=1 Tax=Streptomyces sp. SID9727 TaxID=2706114 RepID=UPI0013CDA586|nr:hypothetical protein [Streptomyces sp. SID9727]NEC69279.1 hypothetical protein [Streptomyces sp. SID9727]
MPAFRDFNFKLLVIEQLMYNDETLTPVFRIADCLKAKGIDEDPQTYAYENDLAFTVLDEARAHFEALEISTELLATVETLVLDGGLEVYQECAPVWDGEDDLFDVGSLEDLDLLPNLRLISGVDDCGIGMSFDTDVLASRGIATD